jgi:hypothetical protein
MPVPDLRETAIAQIVEQVASYIEHQRWLFRQTAARLNENEMAATRPFFSPSVLASVRLAVLTDRHVANPPFYGQLVQMGFDPEGLPNFSRMAAITFMDTVVSHEPFTARLLFHELVHVVQYEKLGLREFANKYVRGFLAGGSYEAIPLEMNAYGLDSRFANTPTKTFSVADEVQACMAASRF